MRRVVVTGLGIIAPTGNCIRDAWRSALECDSGVARISQFDAQDLPVQIAAEVKGFDATSTLGPKLARQSSRFVQFSAVAVEEALRDSGVDVAAEPERCGCVIGVGVGAFRNIEEHAQEFQVNGPRRVSPTLLPYSLPNMAAGFVSVAKNLQGPCFCTSTACASGSHAIGEAYLHLAAGSADVMIAGGAEAATSPLFIACFAKMRALSRRNDAPQEASRPFDRERDGFVMGEGCGIVVLEELDHARRRDARIYAEVLGYGASSDAFHITSPSQDGQGLARSMCASLRAARISADEVDYINAHGTSTEVNDAAESAAIEAVFGERAAHVSISSTKGVTGHCLGAAGAIESVFTVLAIHEGVVPPTANYRTPDPVCRLDYTPGQPREMPVRVALNNSCGFGGQNACLVFRKFG